MNFFDELLLRIVNRNKGALRSKDAPRIAEKEPPEYD